MLKDKKGATINGILMAFIGVVVLLAFVTIIADSSARLSQTVDAVNVSYTMPAAGVAIDLAGQELLSTPEVINTTGKTVIYGANWTIAECVSATSGVKRVCLTGVSAALAGNGINISYKYGVEGYADDSASRTILPLIVIFLAIAVLAFIMWQTGLFEDMKNWF